MAAPTSRPTACIEKQRLLDAYIAATKAVFGLQDLEATALVHGESGLDRPDLALKHARGKRDELKRMYILHVAEHGC